MARSAPSEHEVDIPWFCFTFFRMLQELYSSFDRDSDGAVDYLEFMYANLQGQGRLEQEFLQKSVPKKGYEKYEMIANALVRTRNIGAVPTR